ncbi:MAG: TonB-dependent receptor plug domain-containing protein, partial [Gemmatimonadales bacterium]
MSVAQEAVCTRRRALARWRPLHAELLQVGWTVQLAFGVAWWILPRFRGPERGREELGRLAFILLNTGALAAGIRLLDGRPRDVVAGGSECRGDGSRGLRHPRLAQGQAVPLSRRNSYIRPPSPAHMLDISFTRGATRRTRTRPVPPRNLGMRQALSAVLNALLARCHPLLALLVVATAAHAQETGTVTGTVTRAGEGGALGSVSVTVEATGQSTATGTDGRYTLRRVPAGPQRIVFRWLGYQPTQVDVGVEAGGTVTADAGLEAVTVSLGEIVVQGASRAPERIVEAPAAISVVAPEVLQAVSITGQAPLALQSVPGVDVVQSGVNDFNVNSRGFNSSLNRRVLVLQDGRDLAIAFLGSQEWNGLTQPLEDVGKVEMVRGPGSALYGANAFSGVVNITTPDARDAIGSKVTLSGGELETVRGDVRHASVFAGDRFGFRVNAGYNRSDTYSRTRTRLDGTSLQREYADATDEPVGPARELRALNGQTIDPTTGDAVGDRDPLVNGYGAARLDYYADNGAVVTLDGGASQVQNEIFVTGIGRVQVAKAIKPYIRAAVAAERYNVFAYWHSRTSIDPQFSLQSTLPLEERSDIFHVEGQSNWKFQQDRGRVVYGASLRNTRVNTSGTLMNLANDDRSDDLYSIYGQVEYKLIPELRVVGALRWDDGDLFDRQFSPKGALV